MFGCSVILVVLIGAWISGDWVTGDGDIRCWHPGYFLPTATGGRLAGGASAALGFTTLSHVLFGLGITSFVVLASIISLRLYVAAVLAAAAIAHNRDRTRATSGRRELLVRDQRWQGGHTRSRPGWVGIVDAAGPVEADSAVQARSVWSRLLGFLVPFRRCRHLWRPLAGR